MTEIRNKSKAINQMLTWLQGRIKHSLVAIDHWDADLNAIGVALETDPQRLVYVAAFEASTDYFVELETGPSDESEMPYTSVGTFKAVHREQLLKIVLDHLQCESFPSDLP